MNIYIYAYILTNTMKIVVELKTPHENELKRNRLDLIN